MPDDGSAAAERLVILLEAKINDLEKNMAKASGVTAKAYRQMSQGSKRATQQMENDAIRSTLRINQALAATSTKIGAFSKSFTAGFVAPVAGLLTLTAAINGTRAALDKFGDIADKSAAAGVDPEFFQGLAYAAKLSGVEIDGVASALETFAKNSGLAAEGKGRMVTALQVLNPELLKNIQAATTQEQRVKLVADAIKNAKDQAQAAAIATAAFGDSGVKLVAAFSEGGDAIDRTIAKAKEMGIVVDRDVIAHADDLGDKWDTVAMIIDTKVKTALVNLAPTMVWLVDQAANLANILGNQLAHVRPDNIPSWGGQAKQHLADVLRGQAYPEAAVTGGLGSNPGAEYQFGDMGSFFNPATSAAVAAMRNPGSAGGGGLGVLPSNFDFRAVLDPLVKTTKAAHDATYAIGTTSDAVTQLSQNWQTAEDMAEGFTSTLIDGLTSTGDVLGSVLDATKNLGNELIQMAANQAIKSLFNMLSGGLLGGFGSIAGGAPIPLGGFVPGLTGPKLFADGGVTSTPAIFGDNGPEAAVPLPDGRSIPVTLSGGGAPSITITNHIDARGATADAAPAIANQVTAALRQQLPDAIQRYNRNPYRRG